MKINLNTSIAIIGGGAAGSYLAKKLIDSDFHNITLFDHSAPWAKPCGGGLPAHVFDMIPFLAKADIPFQEIKHVNYYYGKSPSERLEFHIPFSQFNCNRLDLNKYLLKMVRHSELTFLRARVKSIDYTRNKWVIGYDDNKFIKADFLVGADGVFGISRKQLTSGWKNKDLSISLDTFVPRYDSVQSDRINIVTIPEIYGYSWDFPLPGNISSVGIVANSGSINNKKLKDLLVTTSKKCFGLNLETKKITGYAIPSLDSDSLKQQKISGYEWALIGDAAGSVNPVTREGLYFAFSSADLLADALISGISDTYESSWSREIGKELTFASKFGKYFFSEKFQKKMSVIAKNSKSFRDIFSLTLTGKQSMATLPRTLMTNALSIGFQIAVNYQKRKK